VSLIFIDGFDDNLAGLKWTTSNLYPGQTATARTGNGMHLSRDDAYCQYVVPAAFEHATFVIGFAVYPRSPGAFNNDRILELRSDSAATLHVYLGMNTLGQLYVYQGNGTQLGLTPAGTWNWNTWMYLELKVTLHDSTGSFTLRKNGVTILSGTGLDTKNGGTKTVFDSFKIRGTSGNADTVSGNSYDDFYALNGAGSVNNDFLGDCTIQTLYPSGNGNYSQWVGSDADSTNNYLLVDENPPNTTDYVESGTATNKDTYAFADLTGAPNVKGVATRAYMSKSDAGAQLMRQTARIGGTDYPSATDDAPSFGSYTLSSRLMEVSPATSAAWTYTEVNGAEFGVEAR